MDDIVATNFVCFHDIMWINEGDNDIKLQQTSNRDVLMCLCQFLCVLWVLKELVCNDNNTNLYRTLF
jgi:hypothetical protein